MVMLTVSSLRLFAQEQSAQEPLTLDQCRAMALKFNKELAASAQQARYARYTMKSYRALFFPSFSLTGTGLYSTIDGTFGIAGVIYPPFYPTYRDSHYPMADLPTSLE